VSHSSPIRLSWKEKGLAVVVMEERESRNTFSPAFTAGLADAFQAIADNKDARAVVIHGYDNYFSCGATREQLVRLSENQLKYPEIMDFRLLLRCELPVIAAMQGHAIGGGFVFGCYADIIILAEECVYNTNFMHYGFTPGMGATCIIPDKLGRVLGSEMLMTGRNYRGGELQQRGAQVQVTKKAAVIQCALEQAANLAEKPAASLRQLKRRLTETLEADLNTAIESELEMQSLTFSLPEVRRKIDALYGL
jgi:polyketide biosynthesis enoyl-CoA hydratase PksI